MPELAWPWMLMLVLLPLAAGWRRTKGAGPALRLPSDWAIDHESTGSGFRGRSPVIALWALAWCLLCLAAARPQWPVDLPPHALPARSIVLAIDLSGSMAETDMRLDGRAVDRLVAVKAVVDDFLQRRRGDRVGVVVFGSQAFTLTPMTLDLDSLRAQLQTMEIAMAGRETAIGDAIALSLRHLLAGNPAEAAPRKAVGQPVIVLLTDGVNNAGRVDPERATRAAAAAGVRIHAIGFGGDGGPLARLGRSGAEIDEPALEAMVAATGGRYFRARDTAELAGIYAVLDRLEGREEPAARERLLHDAYAWPLAGSLLVGLLALAVSGRRS
ncbi:MAG: VWA domain-containing protein [Lysobacteraceae bacterium]